MTKPQSMLHSCHSSQMQFKLPTSQAGDQSALICKFDNSHCWYAAACDSSVSLDASLGAHAVQSTSPSPHDENSRTLQNPAYRHTLPVRCGRCSGDAQNPVHSMSLTTGHQSGSQCSPSLYHLGLPWSASKDLHSPRTAHSQHTHCCS